MIKSERKLIKGKYFPCIETASSTYYIQTFSNIGHGIVQLLPLVTCLLLAHNCLCDSVCRIRAHSPHQPAIYLFCSVDSIAYPATIYFGANK